MRAYLGHNDSMVLKDRRQNEKGQFHSRYYWSLNFDRLSGYDTPVKGKAKYNNHLC